MPILDLSPVRYSRFVSVVFDHPPAIVDEEGREVLDSGRGDAEFVVSDAARLVSHFSQMCREFVTVSERFTLPQLDRGLWLLLGAEVGFGGILADEDVPLKSRLNGVRAMLIPFRDFVAQSEVEELENCFYMWWDLLTGRFWSAHLWRLKGTELMESFDDESKSSPVIEISIADLNADGVAVLDAMLETLIAIAELDDERAQSYALHGLGHLRHPEGAAWLQRFIDENRDDFDEEGVRWLEQCRDGTVM